MNKHRVLILMADGDIIGVSVVSEAEAATAHYTLEEAKIAGVGVIHNIIPITLDELAKEARELAG